MTHTIIGIYVPIGSSKFAILSASFGGITLLRERLRTHKVLTKERKKKQLNYHKFSIKSYVLDVY